MGGWLLGMPGAFGEEGREGGRHAVLRLLKAPSSPPQHDGCHQDGSSDGAYYKIGGARTCVWFGVGGLRGGGRQT